MAKRTTAPDGAAAAERSTNRENRLKELAELARNSGVSEPTSNTSPL